MAEIENTTRTAKETPIIPLVGLMGDPDGFILGQEAQGARQVLASELLPKEGDWEALEALGFVKGEPVAGDDLFVNATLPEGWTKHSTGHSLWTEIRDERGVKRVAIGYKAAFYDRWASISVVHVGYEYSGDIIYGDGEVSLPAIWDKLTDTEQVLVRERLLNDIAKNEEHLAGFPASADRLEPYLTRARRGIELIDAARG